MQSEKKIKKYETIPMRRYRMVILTLSIGILISFILFKIVNNWERTNQRVEFESRSKGYANAIQNNFNAYLGALEFVGDYLNNSSQMNRQQFSLFVKSALSRYPGIQAFSWNPLVMDNQRAVYESLAQEEGFKNFNFTERASEGKLVIAARRREYVVVYYIDPLEPNKPALGYDIASNPTRLQAIGQAFNSGKPIATSRITLVQETGNQFGVLILLPIYQQGALLKTLEERRKYRKGLAVEVLRIGDVIENALANLIDEGIDLYLYDASDEEKHLLYFRPSRTPKMTDQPMKEMDILKGLHWSNNFEFAGRQWKILLNPSSFYLESHQSWQAWMILLGSLLLTVSLVFYQLKRLSHIVEIEKKISQEIRTNQQLTKEITERRQAEEALRESEERFRNVYETASLAFVVWDKNTRVTDWNKKAEEVFGWSKEDVVGHNFFDFLIPEKDRPQVEDVVNILLKGALLSHSINENLTKEGKIITCEWNNSALHDDDGNIIGAISLGLDITERKQAEEALKESKERFHNLIETTSDWVWEVDKNGVYTYVSTKSRDMLGYDPEEIMGKTPFDLMPYEEAERVSNIFSTIVALQEPFDCLENINLHKNGQPVVLETSGVPIFDADGGFCGYRGIDRNITKRKKTEDQLKQAFQDLKNTQAHLIQTAKLASIGELSSGVAHELNQPLMVIRTTAQLILRAIKKNPLEEDELKRQLEVIERNTKRMMNIIKHLGTFSRKSSLNFHRVDINQVIENTFLMIGEQLHVNDIEVKKNLTLNLPKIQGDSNQLEQVILNLIINARNAMESKAESIGGADEYHREIVIATSVSGDGEDTVEIIVKDNGSGISQECLNKIFDPFFTTKEMGEGTGLGLSISHGIIKNHKGEIEVAETGPKGTTFRIKLPIESNEKFGNRNKEPND